MKQVGLVSKIGILMFLLIAMGIGSVQSEHVTHAQAAIQETVITLSGARILNASLAVADFNGDGYKEIVAGGSDGMLYVVSTSNGTDWSTVWSHQCNNEIEAANPPTSKSTNEIHASPAIADLDGDGHLDIVVAMGGDIHVPKEDRENGGVLVYRYDSAWTFSLIESLSQDGTQGWPQPRIDRVGDDAGYGSPDGYWDGIVTTPAVGDLDGDGDLEIVVAGIDRRIHAWHHNGQVVDGWPIYRDNGDALLRGGLSSPALGDIDDDGLPEVIVGTMSPPWGGEGSPDPDYSKGTLWGINGDSTNVPGFPLETEQYIHSSPALGDIDDDGRLEIVAGVGWGTSGRQNIVYAWNHDGTLLPNWPQETAGVTSAPPALGDIDNDGELEVVIGCGWPMDNSCHTLYAWNPDGTNVPGFPMEPPSPNPGIPGSYTMPYNLILADLDGDEIVEILVVHHGAPGITVVKPDGPTSDNTSHQTSAGLFAPPVVDDVDNDDLLEILAGGSTIRIWDEVGGAEAKLPWPMFRHNVLRNGRYPAPPRLDFPSELRFFHQEGAGSTEALRATVRNLGEGEFDWQITHGIGVLQVSPTSGTVSTQAGVQFTVTTTGYLTGTWHNLGNLNLSGTVASQHIQSSPLTVPVWLYVGDIGRIYLPLTLRNN